MMLNDGAVGRWTSGAALLHALVRPILGLVMVAIGWWYARVQRATLASVWRTAAISTTDDRAAGCLSGIEPSTTMAVPWGRGIRRALVFTSRSNRPRREPEDTPMSEKEIPAELSADNVRANVEHICSKIPRTPGRIPPVPPKVEVTR